MRLPRGTERNKHLWWLACAVSLAALLSQLPSVANLFTYDDRWIISENPLITSAHRWSEYLNTPYWPDPRNSLYRPMVLVMYRLEWLVGAGSPMVFHAVNVALYAAICAVVAVGLAFVAGETAALVGGLWFALLPTHVEAVANVVGQAELWAALLTLAVVALSVRWWRVERPPRRPLFTIAGLLFVAICFKEHVIVFPALAVAFVLGPGREDRTVRAAIRRMLPLILATGAAAVLAVVLRHEVLGVFTGDSPHVALYQRGLLDRLSIMLPVYPEWLRLLTWPMTLSADYAPEKVTGVLQWGVPQFEGAVFVVLALAATVLAWRRDRWMGFGLAWAIISLGPVANIAFASGIVLAERTLFFPSLGVALTLARGWEAVWPYVARRRVLAAAGAVATVGMLVAYGQRSIARGPIWLDNETLFRQMVRDQPTDYKGHHALGAHLYQVRQFAEAERELRLAYVLYPSYPGGLLDLGHLLRDTKRCPDAIWAYATALQVRPDMSAAKLGLVYCQLRLLHFTDAMTTARQALIDGEPGGTFAPLIAFADSALAAHDTVPSPIVHPHKGAPPTLAVVMGASAR